MKKLAVIILNWNGIELLKQFLPAAADFSCSEVSDLIVADNGSDDDSVMWIRDNFPDVRVIEFDKNYGFAEGYNRAIEMTRYPYTVLLNSDVEVTPGWWRPLLDFMESNPEAGGCQPKIRAFRQKELFEYAGAAGGLLDRLGYPFCRGRLFDCVEKDCGQYDGEPRQVAWASGAALCVRTDLYLKYGGLDSRFFAHMEEIDLCVRLAAAGHPFYAVTSSHVFHVGGASLNQGNPKKTYLNFRNNLLLLHKNMPEDEGKKTLFIRRLADTLAFFMFCLKLDFKNANAILKAHRDFRKMKGCYTLFPSRNIFRELPGFERRIVIDRYLKGMKS